MKTHVLKLEHHDDFVSVRDKMGWGKSGRILLVWPERGRLLTRRLDLVLLQRHSQALGATLGLVCTDPLVRAHAQELAIPVFTSMQQANQSSWRQRKRAPASARIPDPEPRASHADRMKLRQASRMLTAHWLRLPIVRMLIFTLGVLAVLTLAATLAPGAEIQLSPLKKNQQVTLQLSASQGIPAPRLSGQTPAEQVTVQVTEVLSVPVSGSMMVANQAARGEILVTNLTEKTITLPAGSVVRTTGSTPERFKTARAGELDAGVGVTLTLPIQALMPGSQGNLPVGALTAIEGELGLDLTVNNPAPTSGGDERRVPAPTEADRRQLLSQGQASLLEKAQEAVGEKLHPGDVLLDLQPVSTTTLSREYVPADETPADRLELNLRQEFSFLVVRAETLNRLGEMLLDASLDEDYQAVAATFSVTHLDAPLPSTQGDYQWQATFARQVEKRVTPEQVVNVVIGLPVDSALQSLQAQLGLAAPPKAKLIPAWWPRFPILPFRIKVSFD